jgi:hypothetical protein
MRSRANRLASYTSTTRTPLPSGYGRARNRRRLVSGHKFKIGQLVNYLGRDRAYGVYQVTQLLPPEGNVFQYRIKNINESHERVAKESELRKV